MYMSRSQRRANIGRFKYASYLVSCPGWNFHIGGWERGRLDSHIYREICILVCIFSLRIVLKFFLDYHIHDKLHDTPVIFKLSLITPVIKRAVPDNAVSKVYRTNSVHKIS